MPVVLRLEGFVFFFYSNEGDPREPMHIHVRKAESLAKFWIKPVNLADNYGFKAAELRLLTQRVEENQDLFERAWNDFFG